MLLTPTFATKTVADPIFPRVVDIAVGVRYSKGARSEKGDGNRIERK